MSSKKIKIEIKGEILYGRVEKSMLPCGKKNCACKSDPSKLHGPYYRWTGIINGKQTSRTLSKAEADECRKMIRNYAKLKGKIDSLLKKSLKRAPWERKDRR